MTFTPKSVVVLGGGPAGLAAAHELSGGGVNVVVLERAPWVGGLSMTVERNGFRFDLGGHRWFTKKQWLQDWFLELMEGELVNVDRISRIYFNGAYFDYPVKIGNVLRETGLITSFHAVGSYAWSRVTAFFKRQPIENIEQAYIEQFGPKLYEMFFRRYTEKVWGRECTQLSADWVTQRTKGLSIWETVANAVLNSSKMVSLIDRFVYPRLGYQRISERMKDFIEAKGNEVRLNSKAVNVRIESGRVVVTYLDAEGAKCEIAADHVISTIPLGKLVNVLEPKAPSIVTDAAKGLEFRSLVTCNVMLDKKQVTKDTWLYVHDEEIGFARIHEPPNWSPDMAPPGKTSLCMEWFATVGDDVWRLSDEEIVERTISHLADDLGFIDRNEVIDAFALRVYNAYPVYTMDYGSRLNTIKDHLLKYEDQLSIVGRGGTFRYNNADHSIEMGLLMGKNLLGEQHDVAAVNMEQEYHEERRID